MWVCVCASVFSTTNDIISCVNIQQPFIVATLSPPVVPFDTLVSLSPEQIKAHSRRRRRHCHWTSKYSRGTFVSFIHELQSTNVPILWWRFVRVLTVSRGNSISLLGTSTHTQAREDAWERDKQILNEYYDFPIAKLDQREPYFRSSSHLRVPFHSFALCERIIIRTYFMTARKTRC